MSYHIKPHLDRAKRLIQAADEQSLVYAALELRLGLELVCYEMLRLRLPYVSPKDIGDWRPQQVLKALQELADPWLFEDATLYCAKEAVGEEPKTWLPVVERKGISPRRWSTLWNKLSNYLHVHRPESPDAPVNAYPNSSTFRPILLNIVAELEPLASSGDVRFSPSDTSFTCSCGVLNKRASATLQPGQIITCLNPNCLKEWVAEKRDDGQYDFRTNVIDILCISCGQKTSVAKKDFRSISVDRGASFTCAACGARHSIHLGFTYDLAEDAGSA
jgi:hypothetical protein